MKEEDVYTLSRKVSIKIILIKTAGIPKTITAPSYCLISVDHYLHTALGNN